ncbi:MAG: hypothetical protein M0P71_14625 [Melioribacteraceae bacterium]|nr:hypothetical protein [Melioribacteraceae bacterium]
MKKFLVLLAILVVTFFNSCKEEINGPIEPTVVRRDYVWKVDTLIESRLRKLTGISYNDIYSLASEPIGDKKLCHFDGFNWITKTFYFPYQAQTLFATSPTNIWFASSSLQSIWLYDGMDSKMHTDVKVEDFTHVFIEDMYGNAPWNVYAVGRGLRNNAQYPTIGVLFHFDGLKWSYLNISPIYAQFTEVYVDDNNGVLIQGYDISSWHKTLWYYENNIIKEIGSKDLSYDVAILKNGTIASSQKKVYSFDKGNLKEILDFYELESSITGIWGRANNDFFAIVNNGIAHYNGTDFKVVFPYPNIKVLDAIVFDKEVIFLVSEESKRRNLMIRGELKD